MALPIAEILADIEATASARRFFEDAMRRHAAALERFDFEAADVIRRECIASLEAALDNVAASYRRLADKP